MHEITLPNAKKNDLAFAAQSIPILGHGNQLKNVTDNAYIEGFKDGNNGNTLSQDYEYDINGNMTTDRNKGITSIAYNPINLPTRVVFENLNPQYSTTWKAITYTYDATGVKLQKTVQQGTTGSYSTTHTKYATHYIYVEDATGETLTFFNHPEGYVEPNTGNGYDYVYQYKDHLGNVRLSYKNTGTGSSPNLEILEDNNYYPFGLKHKGYNNVVVSHHPYRDFQGQELTEDLGLNVHEWRYRISDPAIGRFWQVDPLAEDYVHNGVYNFSENRVIDAVELEGLESFIIHGTTQTKTGHSFSNNALNQLQRIGGNTTRNESFRWNAPLTNTDSGHRALAAKELAAHVASQRKSMLETGQITAEEPITLVGYSHGGNVSIQAADLIEESTGLKVNLITVSTPAYETDEILESSGLAGLEDPNKKSSINSHIQVVHENDAVTSFWGQGNDTYQEGNSSHPVKNYVVPEKKVELKGGIEAHTKLPYHPEFSKFLEQIPTMSNPNK